MIDIRRPMVVDPFARSNREAAARSEAETKKKEEAAAASAVRKEPKPVFRPSGDRFSDVKPRGK